MTSQAANITVDNAMTTSSSAYVTSASVGAYEFPLTADPSAPKEKKQVQTILIISFVFFIGIVCILFVACGIFYLKTVCFPSKESDDDEEADLQPDVTITRPGMTRAELRADRHVNIISPPSYDETMRVCSPQEPPPPYSDTDVRHASSQQQLLQQSRKSTHTQTVTHGHKHLSQCHRATSDITSVS